MASASVKLKFDGESHQVDIETYTKVLLSYSTVIRAAADEVGIDGFVEVSVAANQPGSLEVLLQIASTALDGLLSFCEDNSGDLIQGAATLAAGLFCLKKELANQEPIENVEQTGDGNVSIKTGDNAVIVQQNVYNFYRNKPEATEAIDAAFTVLDDSTAISGLEIHHEKELAFRADKDEFSAIATSQNYENEMVKHKTIEANLTVVKPCLASTKTRKWEFVFQGNKISAPIQDEDFLGRLDQYSFQVGTIMSATLDVTQEYDEVHHTYMNKRFVILKVGNVFAPPATPPMF